MNVSWDPLLEIDHNGPLIGYVIQYTRDGSNDTMSMNITGGTTIITISGLVVLTTYSVRVAAMTIDGPGPLSNAVIGMSGEAGEFNV